MQLRLSALPELQPEAGPAVRLAERDAALLAWLAIEGPTPRARVAAVLWPERDDNSARNSLRQRLFQHRKQIGATLIEGAQTLSLARGVMHDLGDSDAVLGDAAVSIGAEFDSWLERQRSTRRSRVRLALTELCEMAESVADWPDALVRAQEVLALEPLSEDAHRRVMRLHYLAGDRAAALLAFDRCERLLKNEIGARPAPETLALLNCVEMGSMQLGLQPHVLPASLLRPPREAGRDAEREALQAAWNAGQPFLLLGESGMGKSRLLESLARSWPGALLLRARPGDLQVPLAGVARLVDLLCARQPAWMQAPGVPELRQLLAAGPTPRPPPARPDTPAQRPAPRPLAPALLGLLALAALHDPPLSLLFDDWQFADEASVDLIAELLASPALAALRCGYASRSSAGSVAEQRIATLTEHSQLRCVTLGPLDAAAVAALVASLQLPSIDAPALAQALLKRVGANPLYLLEALRHMHECRVPLEAAQVVAPRQVKELVITRLAHLPDAARQLLRVAAVAGSDFSVPLAEAVSGRHLLDLTDAWGVLERQGLLDARGVGHDLYTETVLETLPAPIAQLLHARVATWLEAQACEPARLAAHWRAAKEDARAVPHLLAVARRAWFAGRAPETFDFFRQAAEVEAAQGAPDRAFDHWFDNADAMSEIGSPTLLEDCLRALQRHAKTDHQRLRHRLVDAVLRAMRGEVEAGVGGVIVLLSDAIALGDTRVECECRFAIAHRATADGHFDDALQHLAAGERLLRQAGDSRRAAALAASMAMVLGLRGQSRLALREHERVLPLLEQERDHASWTVSCTAKALEHIRQGDAEMALHEVDRALASAARVSIAPPDTVIILRNVVETLRWAGRFDAALRACDEFARRLAEQGNYPRAAGPAAQLYLQLGRDELARPLLTALFAEPFVRVREKSRVALLAMQASSFHGDASAVEWPPDALLGNDLALAADWAFWSGLQDRSPWPADDHEALALRCQSAGLCLLARPLAALAAQRLLQAGARDRAEHWLVGARAPAFLDRLHAATPWAALFGAQALLLAGEPADAEAVAGLGAAWLQRVARASVPDAFRSSFLQRSPVNRTLLTLGAQFQNLRAR